MDTNNKISHRGFLRSTTATGGALMLGSMVPQGLYGAEFPIAEHRRSVNIVIAHNLWEAERLRELIFAYPNVVAYFNGHRHDGDYHIENGVHFLNFKGMVESETNAFAIVDFYENRLVITGHGQEESRVLELPTLD